MADNIEALVDQNAQRAQVLSTSADHTLETISQMSNSVETLSQTTVATGQEVQASFDALVNKLAEIEQNLIGEVQSAKEGLNTLKDKIDQLESQSEAIANEMKTQLDELKSDLDQALAEIGQEADVTETELNETSQKSQDLTTEIENCGQTAGQEVQELHSLIDATKSEFNTNQSTLISQLDTFHQDLVVAKLTALMNDFNELMEEGDSKLSELEATVDISSDGAIQALENQFISTFPGELSNAASELNRAMSFIRESGLGKVGDLTGKFNDVLGDVDQILDLLEQMKPILEAVNSF
ncbi:MAG: hypothetical protein KME45_33055 [Stenomitos rutilans HA7619-LM2]|jgi:gas vesicle protein|nr:hypothetical protein [Stenomitos rutilans HA7619-LM2]